MDYQRFIKQLPSVYENLGQELCQPKSDKFQQLLNEIPDRTTANAMQLLNFAVACLESGEVYCQAGCFQGATLIAALLNNPERIAYAVDNFSEFTAWGDKLDKFVENISRFDLEEQVLFCNQDFEEFFLDLREAELDYKIGLYLYQGSHDYRSQLLSLLLVKPFLADNALIVINYKSHAVQQAILDFMATNPECMLLLESDIYLLAWAKDKTEIDLNNVNQKRNHLFIKTIKGDIEEQALWEKMNLRWSLSSGLIARIECPAEWVIYNDIFVDGEYDIPIDQALKLSNKNKFIFLDLGANVGFFTLRLADRILRNKKPIINLQGTLVEGSPSVYTKLKVRVRELESILAIKLETDFKLVHGLVGERQGSEKIFESFFHGMNSIFSQPESHSIDVPFIDLDSLYEEPKHQIDLLKCDIEGAELLFLKNYKHLLERVRCAVFELHHKRCAPRQCFEILTDIGFANHQLLREEPRFSMSVHFFWK